MRLVVCDSDEPHFFGERCCARPARLTASRTGSLLCCHAQRTTRPRLSPHRGRVAAVCSRSPAGRRVLCMGGLTPEQREHIEQRARERAAALVIDDETAETLRILLSKPAARALVERRAASSTPV